MSETTLPLELTPMPQLSREVRRQKSFFEDSVGLSVQLSKIGDRRKVPTKAVDVGKAKPEWMGVTKKLFESKSMQEITTLDGEIRKYLYARSVPSNFFKGVYFVSTQIAEQVDKQLIMYSEKRKSLAEAFAVEYPSLLEAARIALNEHFDATDYPTVLEAYNDFTMEWLYIQIATPANLVCASAELLEREQTKMQAKMAEIGDSVSQLLTQEMLGLVDNMVDKLRPGTVDEKGKLKKPVFREANIVNFREFFENFQYRNITNNAELDAVLGKCRQLLAGVEVKDLRDNDSLRETVRAGFDKVKEELAGMIDEAPRRAIRVED